METISGRFKKHRKLYYSKKAKFKKECDEILNSEKNDMEKEEEIQKLGQRYDEEFKEEIKFPPTSLSLENFESFASRYIKGKKESTEIIKKKIDDLGKFGIHTDRAFNLINNTEITGDFNYKVKWVHDILYQKCWEWQRKNKKASETIGQIKGSEIIPIMENKKTLNLVLSILPNIIITDKEFKDIIGIKKLSGEQIKRLMEKYTELIVRGPIAYRYYNNGKTWQEFSISGSIATVITEKTGEYTTFKKPKYRHFFIWHPAGFLLFYNLLQQKFTLFNKDFYRLPKQEQEIYRKVAQHSASSFSLPKIREFLGHKEAKNIRKQIPTFKKYLFNLKKKGFIYSFRVTGRGKKTVFHIFRVKIKKKSKE